MNTQRGFTLLEMLAALAVLALCATVLLGAFGQSARALQQSARSDRLEMAARSLMDDLGDGPLQAGTREGQWDGLPWTCEISAVPSLAGAARMFRVELTVKEAGRHVHFSTFQVRSGGGLQ
jgi:general secretion pathway protein I